jgi:hypothetical protein
VAPGVSQSAWPGEIADAPAGTLVHLVRPDASARSLDALGATVVDSTEVDAQGRFGFDRSLAGDELLISAPGRALTRVPFTRDPVRLEDEARVHARVGEAEVLALALDAAGAPLPLPAHECVSGQDGTLEVPRLPAGSLTLLFESADGLRHGSQAVTLSAGERLSFDVSLSVDHATAQRFRRAVGGAADQAADLLGGAQ